SFFSSERVGFLSTRGPSVGRGRRPGWTLAFCCVALAALTVSGCNDKPRLGNFLLPGFRFERTFGQLYIDGGTPSVSHYTVIRLVGSQAPAVADGRIEYATLEGLGDCVILHPKMHSDTPNNFSQLQALPAPGELLFAYCNLSESTVRTQVRRRFDDVNFPRNRDDATDRLMDPEREA